MIRYITCSAVREVTDLCARLACDLVIVDACGDRFRGLQSSPTIRVSDFDRGGLLFAIAIPSLAPLLVPFGRVAES